MDADTSRICGELRHEITIVDSDDILFLGLGGQATQGAKVPEPQLIAEAIAAFQAKKAKTDILASLDNPIEAKVIPGVVSSSAAFFKLPVTTELAEAFALGDYSATRTVVQAHLPARRLSEGMKPLDKCQIRERLESEASYSSPHVWLHRT